MQFCRPCEAATLDCVEDFHCARAEWQQGLLFMALHRKSGSCANRFSNVSSRSRQQSERPKTIAAKQRGLRPEICQKALVEQIKAAKQQQTLEMEMLKEKAGTNVDHVANSSCRLHSSLSWHGQVSQAEEARRNQQAARAKICILQSALLVSGRAGAAQRRGRTCTLDESALLASAFQEHMPTWVWMDPDLGERKSCVPNQPTSRDCCSSVPGHQGLRVPGPAGRMYRSPTSDAR